MFNEPPSKEVLDEIQLQKYIDVKTQFWLQKNKWNSAWKFLKINKWKKARKTCIIWDHDDVCRESPPIFIEISGA